MMGDWAALLQGDAPKKSRFEKLGIQKHELLKSQKS
jgi:hypothetical protein